MKGSILLSLFYLALAPVATAQQANVFGESPVAIKNLSGLYVTADQGKKGQLFASKEQVGTWETFLLETNDDGTASFRCKYNGLYISSEGGKREMYGDRENAYDFERFTMFPLTEKHIALLANNGLYVSANHEEQELWADGEHILEEETFDLEYLDYMALQTQNGAFLQLAANEKVDAAAREANASIYFQIVENLGGYSLLATNQKYLSFEPGQAVAMSSDKHRATVFQMDYELGFPHTKVRFTDAEGQHLVAVGGGGFGLSLMKTGFRPGWDEFAVSYHPAEVVALPGSPLAYNRSTDGQAEEEAPNEFYSQDEPFAGPAPSIPEGYTDYPNKFALVIGNSAYQSAPLKNPVNDAKSLSAALEQLDFTVLSYTDLSRAEMREAIREFGHLLSANKGVGLFFYAGHGLQSQGINYLVPVGANIQEEYEIEDACVRADQVLRMMELYENPMNIVILDACRNNPFASAYRSADRGLAQPESAPIGSIIAFSTAPGKTASDGTGDNGLYTEELLKAIRQPNLSIEAIFKQVRIEVLKRSEGSQSPWENSSLTGDFYFSIK